MYRKINAWHSLEVLKVAVQITLGPTWDSYFRRKPIFSSSSLQNFRQKRCVRKISSKLPVIVIHYFCSYIFSYRVRKIWPFLWSKVSIMLIYNCHVWWEDPKVIRTDTYNFNWIVYLTNEAIYIYLSSWIMHDFTMESLCCMFQWYRLQKWIQKW